MTFVRIVLHNIWREELKLKLRKLQLQKQNLKLKRTALFQTEAEIFILSWYLVIARDAKLLQNI